MDDVRPEEEARQRRADAERAEEKARRRRDETEDDRRRREESEDVRRRREETEREVEAAETTLTPHERDQVTDARRLSAVTVYAVIRREGEEELHRPKMSLWWSGLAAGLGISTSVFAEGILHHGLEGSPYRPLIENFGYSIGFILVILSRLQLFTENTITVVLPVLAEPSWDKLRRSARLWSIVFSANMVGTFLAAYLTLTFGTTTEAHMEAMLDISRHFAESRGLEALVLGVPAGFIIASLVWMLPSAKGFELMVILLFTYLIAVCDLTHVVAGATEVFLLVVAGELGFLAGVWEIILPTLIGNIIGGTGLFAMLAYAQVHQEM